MNSQIFFIINLILGIAVLAAGVYIFFTLKKIQDLRLSLTDGAQNSNLEDILAAIAGKIKRLEHTDENLQQQLMGVQTFVQKDIRGIGIHKFNAFPDEGGNLSFTIALLSNTNSGFVLSSIHGRSNNRIYIKTIESGKSGSELTSEEQTAIIQAQKNIS